MGWTQSKRTEEARAAAHVKSLQGQVQTAQARQAAAAAEVARALEQVKQREAKQAVATEAEPTADATTPFGEPRPSREPVISA